MYTSSILMLLEWPVLIIISWFAVLLALKAYEKKMIRLKRMPDREV
jgi:hypothetical protein